MTRPRKAQPDPGPPDVQPVTPGAPPAPPSTTAPDTRPIPEYMLEVGDHVWHQGRGWFHRCTVEGTAPGNGPAADGNGMFQVAQDPRAAATWNQVKRGEKMG